MNRKSNLNTILALLIIAFLITQLMPLSVDAATTVKGTTQVGAPLQAFDTTTPFKGKVKALIFKVEFQDVVFPQEALSAKKLKNAVFGPENTDSIFYPLESVTAYYERASYDALKISGEVYSYKAKYKRSYYSKNKEYETLAMEVLSSFDNKIDYSRYDQDEDGYIDCMSLSVPVNNTKEDGFWYGCQATWYDNSDYVLDGVKVKAFIINDEPPVPDWMDQYNATLIHEIGHSMGLPDYYKYNTTEDWEGLKGEAGIERMDDSLGDFSAFSKMMIGWIPAKKVQIANRSKKAEVYSLTASNESQSCLLIPVGTLDKRYFSEYFLVEYLTPTENDYGLFHEGGIRVLHVDAKTIKDVYTIGYSTFRYDNFSSYYDSSDKGIRILKLVGEENGFYRTGDTISHGISGFGIYNHKGKAVNKPGFSIEVGDLVDGNYQITVKSK